MRSLPILFIALLGTAGLLPADEKAPKEGTSIVHLDAPGAAKLLATKDAKKRPLVIDIRTPEEYKEGHIKGARLIDYLADDFSSKLSKLDREQAYLIHCRSGGRSSNSLEIWKKLGFRKIYHLDGGIKAWNKAKLPLEK